MSFIDFDLLQADRKDAPKANVEYSSDIFESRKEFDVSRILVQVVKRPQDPITRQLDRCLHLWAAGGIPIQTLVDPFCGWIDVARNWQTYLFRKNRQFDYVLLVDSDVGPPVEAPILLRRHGAPVVSGCVPSFTIDKGLFLCLVVRGEDGVQRFVTLKGSKKIPGRGLIEVDHAGAGCLMIRRDVVEVLWDRFEKEQDDLKETKAVLTDLLLGEPLDEARKLVIASHLKRLSMEKDLSGAPFSIPQSVRDAGAELGVMKKGEDIMFSERVRAAGFKIYADLEVQCYHEKMMALQWPKDAIDNELSVDEWKITAFDAPAVVL